MNFQSDVQMWTCVRLAMTLFTLSLRSKCHLCELVSDGLLRHGGVGLSKDPAASHY